MSVFDVCVAGHITRDVVRSPSRTVTMAGGTAYYAGITYARLGLSTAIVTKTSIADAPSLLAPLVELGCDVRYAASTTSMHFENILSSDLASRTQRVPFVADAFDARDLEDVRAGIVHLGPLTMQDMSVEFIAAAAERGGTTMLDGQGLLRKVENGAVRPAACVEKHRILAMVDILKVDRDEAQTLSGEGDLKRALDDLRKLGPREIIVTLGEEGSLVCAENTIIHVAPFRARVFDPTGAGDTFSAGYAACRLRGVPPPEAARFASAVASLSVETSGAFAGDFLAVEQRLARGE